MFGSFGLLVRYLVFDCFGLCQDSYGHFVRYIMIDSLVLFVRNQVFDSLGHFVRYLVFDSLRFFVRYFSVCLLGIFLSGIWCLFRTFCHVSSVRLFRTVSKVSSV